MTSPNNPRIELCPPGEPAFQWLSATLDVLKAPDPLAPVTVVPSNMPAGRMLLRQLASRSGYVNVRIMRLADIAAAIARPLLAGREPLTPVLEASAARVAASEVQALQPVAGHLALTQALVRLFRELRRSEMDLQDLSPEASPMAHAAAQVYARFRALTAELADSTRIRRLAAERLAGSDAPQPLADIGALLLFMPTRIDPADADLLAALSPHLPLAIALPDIRDPQGLGSRRALRDYGRLIERLGVHVPETQPSQAKLSLPPNVRIIGAPDPAEEAREVVRAVVASMEAGTPLWRMAVLYRQPDAYASLLHDAFELAGLPCFGLGGIALAEARPARVLLGLLRLPDKSFGRESVLGVIAEAPAFAQPGQPSHATWERISRDANVVRGADQWISRLRAYADHEESRPPRTHEGEEAPTEGALMPRRADRARHMATTIEEMTQLLHPPADGASWEEFVAWAEQANERFCGALDLWPDGEQGSARMVRTELAGLLAASRFESSATLSLFRSALEDVLASTTCPAGQLGNGIVLGPVQSVSGMSFDQVFLVGLNEGAFPPSPPASPFFPTEAEDVLKLREQYRGRDREAFLAAIASARQHVTLSAPRSAGGRAAFPSRWLLEIASELMAGQPVSASAFDSLTTGQNPWLRIVRSAREAVSTAPAPADLEDRRLADASAWTQSRRPLVASALAKRNDLPLGRALQASAARRSRDFTEFDGNLAELASASHAIGRLFNGERALSASSVQAWASCPFSYFLANVLGVRSSEAPEDRWTIDPAERGTLVHNILEEFLRTQSEADPPLGTRPYNDQDRDLLRQITDRHFAQLRTSGRAGNPLVWQATAADVWADLELFLRQDQVWRQENDWQPARFEQSFGFDDDASWPALELDVEGVRLRFRGQVDRIDLASDGRRAFLYDYKTGGVNDYKEVEVDPVIAGRALQLASYSEVAKRNLPEAEVRAAYWFVSTRGGFAMHGPKASSEQVSARLHEALRHIARGIREGVFPAVPGEENEFYGTFASCTWCPYDRVCPTARDQLWLAKHEAVACQEYEALALPEPR